MASSPESYEYDMTQTDDGWGDTGASPTTGATNPTSDDPNGANSAPTGKDAIVWKASGSGSSPVPDWLYRQGVEMTVGSIQRVDTSSKTISTKLDQQTGELVTSVTLAGDKIVNSVGSAGDAVVDSIGSVGDKLDGIGNKIDATNVLLSQIAGNTASGDSGAGGGSDPTGHTGVDDALSAHDGGSPAYAASVPSGSPNPGGIVAGPGQVGSYSFSGHAVNVTFTPTGTIFENASSLLTACRNLLLWAAGIGFVIAVGREVRSFAVTLPQTNAAGGAENYVPGVAQAKTWALAGAIVLAIFACVASMVVLADSYAATAGLSVSSLFSSPSLAPLGSGLGLLDRYI